MDQQNTLLRRRITWSLLIIISLFILINSIAQLYLDYQWFALHKQVTTFVTLFFTKFKVHFFFSFVFIILFYLNFLLLRLLGGKSRIYTTHFLERLKLPFARNPHLALHILMFIIVFFIAYIMGSGASSYWKEYLLYSHQTSFKNIPHNVDPIFSNDLGFYMFSLPFYKFVYTWLMLSLVMLTGFSIMFHLFNGGIVIKNSKPDFSLFSRTHVSTLLAMIIALYGIGYRLSAYSLLLSQRSKFFGAGYTDVHAQLLAYNICMWISFIAALLFLFNIIKKSFKLPLIVIICLIPLYFFLGILYPGLQQRFLVIPNELAKEKPYITHNITYTRIAYNLFALEEKEFENNNKLSSKDINNNINTLHNIRLWDWKPLKETYKQLQELKPYYHFHDVDVDRYTFSQQKIAVNISARELFINKLSKNSQTWINQHLVYTHGYGITMSRVDKITPEGLPDLIVKDIPPKSKVNFTIKRPEIYYGEHNNPYVLTNTNITPGEFDYPFGETNRYSTYNGTGGIVLDSFLKRFLIAIAMKDANLLISQNIDSHSRIHFKRNIVDMVRTLTPYLDFDHDPYVVAIDGRLYWIIDGYTSSNNFPYSTPVLFRKKSINYIRNSVKVVIDAYNGDITYYVTDTADPILATYRNIFPTLFTPFSEMPDAFKEHIRYPESLFNIQSYILLRYHMKDLNVFYNNEDAWGFATHIYEESKEIMPSHYFVTKLPGEKEAEFILMLPFTPDDKDNMIGFLVAKCDPQHYGNLVLYRLPKEKLSYGPMQIEARINQDADISKQLTLWSQKGSKVIRGNMLALPIEESLLFIEPLYLKAESSQMPELKRVILAFADRIVMAENLPQALEKMFQRISFSEKPIISSVDDKNIYKKIYVQYREYINKAYNHYLKAESYQRKGNWSQYGKELQELKNTLQTMKELRERTE